MARLFYNCLKDFGIESKLQGLTVGNASTNETFMEELGKIFEENGLFFDIENQHFECLAHVLHLAVQDMFKIFGLHIGKQIDEEEDTSDESENESDEDEEYDNPEQTNVKDFLVKIRATCKKIKRSDQLRNLLEKFCDISNIKYLVPVIDVQTRWNSSCKMLETAKKLRPHLAMMRSNCPKLRDLSLNDYKGKNIEQILDILPSFKQVSDILTGEKYPTLASAVCSINLFLDKIEHIACELGIKEDGNLIDANIILALQAARDRILKYYNKTN